MIIKKLWRHITVFCLFTGIILCSCDDDLSKVGTTIQPPEDLITVFTDTFTMKASTIRLDSIFAKTSDFLLGEMYDPLYGNIKADVLCQFYCEEGFQFHRPPINGLVDSVELIMFYFTNSYGGLDVYGDTMTPMQVSVFPIDRPLKRNYYSNENPANFCDMNNPLAVKSYTAYDVGVPDHIRYEVDGYGDFIFTPSLTIKLPTELGQRIYDETINNPSTFASQSAFNEFFPGLYLTNTYGSGCIIKTNSFGLTLRIFYDFADKGSDGVSDTVIRAAQSFKVSKEVIQLNRFDNSNLDQLLEDNTTHTFVKAPAGVCTKLVIPTTDISNALDVSERYINGFSLSLKYLPSDEWNYSYSPPSHLLLLPQDSVKSFFEKGTIEDGAASFISFGYDVSTSTPVTSSLATDLGHNPYTRTYTFGNISSLLKTHMLNSPDKDLSLLVIPVTRSTTYSNGYYTIGISNSFNLSGVKIRTDEDLMKVVVLSSKFENK